MAATSIPPDAVTDSSRAEDRTRIGRGLAEGPALGWCARSLGGTTSARAPQPDDRSLDGSKIVFQTNRDANDEIYLMNANGSVQVDVSRNGASDLEPAW